MVEAAEGTELEMLALPEVKLAATTPLSMGVSGVSPTPRARVEAIIFLKSLWFDIFSF